MISKEFKERLDDELSKPFPFKEKLTRSERRSEERRQQKIVKRYKKRK